LLSFLKQKTISILAICAPRLSAFSPVTCLARCSCTTAIDCLYCLPLIVAILILCLQKGGSNRARLLTNFRLIALLLGEVVLRHGIVSCLVPVPRYQSKQVRVIYGSASNQPPGGKQGS
jgi:hypothetical protein